MTALKRTRKTIRPHNSFPLLVMEPALVPLCTQAGEPWDVMANVPWPDLEGALRRLPPTVMVMVNPYAGEPRGARFPLVRDLLRRFPSVPVVAALELRPDVGADVPMLLEWGVSEVLALGPESTATALRARLREAHARPFKRRLEEALSPWVGVEARNILRAAAEVAVEGGQAQELAVRLEVTQRTLTVRCGRADLPAPRHTQAWMRVLLACMLLDDPGRTVYSAAYASGYATERSLRRAITTFLDVDSTSLRKAGAFASAAAAFNDALRAAREERRERRREPPAPGPAP